MKTAVQLTNSHQRTFDRIFQHPISHNLEWRDVIALLEEMGDVAKEHNGNLKVTRNGQTLVLHPTSKKDVTEMDEVVALRHFLKLSETATPDPSAKETHWLLVIDHHEARIFHAELEGSIPQRISPYEPGSYFRHKPDSVATSRGQEKPDPNTFFEPVAKILEAAGPILVFGTGTGTSSEMDQFVAWLKHHHPNTAKRIVGSVVVDEHHLTEGQLLASARDFYRPMPTPDAAPTAPLSEGEDVVITTGYNRALTPGKFERFRYQISNGPHSFHGVMTPWRASSRSTSLFYK